MFHSSSNEEGKYKFCFNIRVKRFDWKSKTTLNLVLKMINNYADSLDAT